VGEEATPEGPARRRTSWSLKTIVEDVAGRPVGELQDPERPLHPYWRGRMDALPSAPVRGARTAGVEGTEAYDPVGHLYPPLYGPTGRAFHGPAGEHHLETLERHRVAVDDPARPAGPARRPERLYLHYLLLHLDRLSDSALRYLRHAVDEEIAHRAEPGSPPPDGSRPAPTPPPLNSS
jgi:hypothetical protein